MIDPKMVQAVESIGLVMRENNWVLGTGSSDIDPEWFMVQMFRGALSSIGETEAARQMTNVSDICTHLWGYLETRGIMQDADQIEIDGSIFQNGDEDAQKESFEKACAHSSVIDGDAVEMFRTACREWLEETGFLEEMDGGEEYLFAFDLMEVRIPKRAAEELDPFMKALSPSVMAEYIGQTEEDDGTRYIYFAPSEDQYTDITSTAFMNLMFYYPILSETINLQKKAAL